MYQKSIQQNYKNFVILKSLYGIVTSYKTKNSAELTKWAKFVKQDLEKHQTYYKGNKMHDVGEVLFLIISLLETDIINLLSNNIVKENYVKNEFEFRIFPNNMCACGGSQLKGQLRHFICKIQNPALGENTVRLMQCIMKTIEADIKSEFCDMCKLSQTKFASRWDKYPRTLIVHLSRVNYIDNVLTKLSTKVNLPNVITIGMKVFNLTGIIEHSGKSATTGHFSTVIKRNNCWYEVSDKRITKLRGREDFENKFTSANSFILCYESSDKST